MECGGNLREYLSNDTILISLYCMFFERPQLKTNPPPLLQPEGRSKGESCTCAVESGTELGVMSV